MPSQQEISEQVRIDVKSIRAVADAIRTLEKVPNGHLYAQLMGVMSLGRYESIIRKLKEWKLVSESGNLLKWTGPVLEVSEAA